MTGPKLTQVADSNQGGPAYRLARTISEICSPPVLGVFILVVCIYLTPTPGAWRYGLLYAGIVVGLPMLDLLWLRHTGRITDLHLPLRADRVHPFLFNMCCSAAALAIFSRLNSPPLLIAIIRAVLLQTIVLFVITMAWQVSVHTATAASLVTLVLLAVGSSALGMLALLPVVGWSRIYLRRHTLAQVVAGALIGAATLLVGLRGVPL